MLGSLVSWGVNGCQRLLGLGQSVSNPVSMFGSVVIFVTNSEIHLCHKNILCRTLVWSVVDGWVSR